MTTQQAFEMATREHQAGRLATAESLYRQIIGYEPRHAGALYMLGRLLHQAGRPQDAVPLIAQAVALKPQVAEGHMMLGLILVELGRAKEALPHLQRAAELQPDSPEVQANLGTAFQAGGDLPQAIAAYHKAVALRLDFAEGYYNLGTAINRDDLDQTIAAYRRAVALKPDMRLAWNNLGNALKDTGQIAEAIDCYRRSLAIQPDPTAAANLLFALHFDPDYGPQRIFEEHVRWNQTYARPLAESPRPHGNDRSPDRRLRVAYVSADFGRHPVGRFMLPLLASRNHAEFETFCYSDVQQTDSLTAQLQAHADTWRQTRGLPDATFADLVRQDRIDILVDLAAHTEGSRLLAFARKPAPVQVTYLAYCSTTGLETMDYRLSDPYLDPPEAEDRWYTEKSVRLPHTYWCYPPPDEAPPQVTELPARTRGHITFGCLNNFAKVTPAALAIWGQLLCEVPDSQLVLHAYEGSHRDRARKQIAEHGVDPARVSFVGRLPKPEYHKQFEEIDIALDTFPFPGGMTSCDALWMGAPVVSLAGQTAVSRAGLSVLSNIGLGELVARTPEQYLQIARDLARDVDRLSELRATMRQRMTGSPLMDAARFARDFEAALRLMWQCGTAAPGCVA